MLPVSAAEWEIVCTNQNNLWGNPVRNAESCRKKFSRDRNRKPPTGDPNCPTHIKLANISFREIKQKCEVNGGDDSEEDEMDEDIHNVEEVYNTLEDSDYCVTGDEASAIEKTSEDTDDDNMIRYFSARSD